MDGRLVSLRAEASRGYDLSNSGEAAAGYMQAIMLAEIAIQLAKQNEQLERIAITLDGIGKDMSAVNLDEHFVGAREDEAGTHPPDCDCLYCLTG